MKLSNALSVLFLVASVSALPEPICGKRGQPCKREALPEPICGKRGQPCKREPYAEAICGKRGQPCRQVKRAAEAFAEAFAEPIAAPEDEVLMSRCNLVGGACYEAKLKARELADIVSLTVRDPEAYIDGLVLETREGQFSIPPYVVFR